MISVFSELAASLREYALSSRDAQVFLRHLHHACRSGWKHSVGAAQIAYGLNMHACHVRRSELRLIEKHMITVTPRYRGRTTWILDIPRMGDEKMDKRFLTTEEVAERLSITPRTVHRWRAERCGPPYARFGKSVRYDVDELEKWIAEATVNHD